MKTLPIPASGKAPALIEVPTRLTAASLDALMADLKAAEENLKVGSLVLVFPVFDQDPAAPDPVQLFPELAGVAEPARAAECATEWSRRVEYLRNVYVPVVAAIDGRCSGWALDLALAADLIVCGGGAELAVHDCPDSLGYLAVACGIQRLKRMLMFGERLDGPTAVDWGIANQAVQGSCRDAACELARRLALPPRDLMSVLKESLNAIEEHRIGVPAQWGS